jgi:superfamily I DNA and RNA helicase
VIKVIWGSNKNKPIASKRLADKIMSIQGVSGYLYIGYPVIGSPSGVLTFDALLLSELYGIVGIDLVEGTVLENFEERQDSIATMLEVKLKPYDSLKQGRNLKFVINTLTYAPAVAGIPEIKEEYHNVCNDKDIFENLSKFHWNADLETYELLTAAIQVVTNIRANSAKRVVLEANSRGAKLKRLEESIANLDQHQSEAVVETVEGVQRIRGLAGSGKTIVLALKIAYLHSQNPEWKIAVTFNTRSLKEQFRRLINNFTIEQTGSEPNWENVSIINAWGGPGSADKDGIYHQFCKSYGLQFIDFGTAENRYGKSKAFEVVCKTALQLSPIKPSFKYDLILIDEAQDFSPDFIRLCFEFLNEPKRLVYAYDELQSLNGNSLLPPEELFGYISDGKPRVTLSADDPTQPKQDIILEKCYRNSRPLLASAHALGFGLYRDKGLVQFFDNDSLWEEVGYKMTAGSFEGNSDVELIRTPDTSPMFLEEHSPINDLISFHTFQNVEEMDNYLVQSILGNIRNDELKPEDILVINPDPLTSQRNFGNARAKLLSLGVNSEVAGVTTSRDIFSKSGNVTFTGIYRAKGNEAGMVYIIHAQDCYSHYDINKLHIVRNQLFTAITRSKAWVRVIGIGQNMANLSEEWNRLYLNEFALKFRYPTPDEKLHLKLINKDMSGREKVKHKRIGKNIKEFVQAFQSGELDKELIPQEFWDMLDKMKR